MSINLPGSIVIGPPKIPSVTVGGPPVPVVGMDAPGGPSVVVVPQQGPPGPQGPPGIPGNPADTLAFVQNVSPSMTTVLINHGLVFQPAGILCLETTGATVLGATVTYPQPGWIELQFGAPFNGTVFLS